MDILTQGVLGAVMAQSAAQKSHIRVASATGFFAGILADADIFIYSSTDPLLTLDYHRHFTHSVFFIPFGALLAALIAWPLLRTRLEFRQIYLFCLFGYMLSGFVDACTSYGTYLFWPLSQQALSFNIISIVDPLFTLVLLTTLLITVKNRNPRVPKIGLAMAGAYLLFGWSQLQNASDISRAIAAQRGHQLERLLVKPTLGNLFLWRSIYQYDGRLYVDAVRTGLFSDSRIYTGDSVALFDPARHYPALSESSVLYNDIQRFMKFSDNYVAQLPEQPSLLGDIRYSMLPNSVRPLWGLSIDDSRPQQHADYRISRDISEQTRGQFMSMLLGRDQEPD